MILGNIKSVDNVNGLRVQIDGEDSTTTKKYSYLASYVPAAGDRVLIEEIGGSYVIIGKITTEVSKSGIVREAATATTAGTCTGNAATATTAASCTGNAATATTAAACTGNAATATTAANLSGSGQEYGQLVTYVQTQYSSAIGGNYVSSITLGGGHNFVYKGV